MQERWQELKLELKNREYLMEMQLFSEQNAIPEYPM